MVVTKTGSGLSTGILDILGIVGILGVCMIIMTGCQTSDRKSHPNSSPKVAVVERNEGEQIALEHHKAALVNVELGLRYLSQGEVARAKTKLTHALHLDPKATETHSAMAYFLERVGDHKDAEKEHKKAVKYGKEGGAVYNNYGAFLCRQGRVKEADVAFKKALADKNYPRTAEVYENAGICALQATECEKAENYFMNAIRQDPKRTNALLELTALNLKQNKLDAAKLLLSQYKQIAEPSAKSLWLGIQLSHKLKDQNGVASNAQSLKNLFEDSPEYQQYLTSEINKS